MGGLKFKVTEAIKLGFDLAYVDSTASMDSFRFLKAEEWAASKPVQNFDMHLVDTYSDLDTSRFESDLWAKFGFGKALFLYADWRYVDYADNAPYLYDTSGEISWYTLSLGWSF